MMKSYTLSAALTVCLTLAACSNGENELPIFDVDVKQNTQVKLSEIASDVRKITLEFTEQSMVGWVQKAICEEGHLMLLDGTGVMIFDEQGTFVRRIGRQGRGPGEYLGVNDIAYDSLNDAIYFATMHKLMAFDMDGNRLEEVDIAPYPEFVRFVDGRLLVISSQLGLKTEQGYMNQTKLYTIDCAADTADSVVMKTVHTENLMATSYPRRDYISTVGGETYLYYPVLTTEKFIRDTLCILRDNRLLPALRLRFSNENVLDDNGNRSVTLTDIWRTDRFIFADYQCDRANYRYMHDLTDGRSANMKDGYEDDIHHCGTVDIRPLGENRFYYIHTPEDMDMNENPSIYIGKFL